ncbi:MAG: TIGR01906 family membrane protein [Candidatus Limnocylindrales bacterium]
MATLRGALAALIAGVATALVVVALAILPFLNPVWVGFEQGRAQAPAWTGFAPDELSRVTNEILADLVIGPPAFDVELDGQPVLVDREREHMRDVRSVFAGFALAAVIGVVVLLVAYLVARALGVRSLAAFWRRQATSGKAIVVVTAVGGLMALVFFDAAFELFHRLFFPAGTYLFDPGTDRLVQLFPQQFWVETTIGVGIVVIVLSIVLTVLAGRRAARLDR